MRFLRRSLIGLFLVSLTLALFVAAGVRLSTTIAAKRAEEAVVRPARERQFAVNVITAEAIETTPILSTFGEIRARRTLELRVPSGGRIVEMSENFEEGGVVAAGEVILRLDPTETESALRVAQADLRESEAELQDAGRALELARDDLAAAQSQLELRIAARERQESLSSRGVGSASAVETAALSEAAARQAVLSRRQALANSEAALAAAQTAVLRSEIAQADAERALDDMVVVADFAGTLTEVSGALGALVGGNEQIGTLIAPGDLEVAFRISTEQYSRLIDATGRVPARDVVVALDVSGIDLSATGQIDRESAAVSEGQTGRLLFARLGDAPGFRPGDFVTVHVSEPALSDVAILPASAVDAAGTVLGLSADSRLEVFSAPVLRRQGDDVIVEAGEIAGRQIVAERSPLLGAGIRVRVNGVEDQAVAGRPTEPAGQSGDGATVALSDDRRAKLIAFVDGNDRMPEEMRARIKEQLASDEVPAELVTRLESSMGS